MKITVKHKDLNVPYHVYEIIQIFFDINIDLELIPSSDQLSVTVNDGDNSYIFNIDEETESKQTKRDLYMFLSEHLNYSSPWGCMTGIRPAKIVNTLQKSGFSSNDILKELSDFYLIRDDKANLTVQTANVQGGFLEKQYKNPERIGLYSGIPFCPTRCLYCSFTSNSITKYKKVVDTYLDLIEKEIIGTIDLIKQKNFILESIYLGGGTPTSLSEKQFERYLDMFTDNMDTDSLSEFSLEAGRPDSITRQKLICAKEHGVNRISINPQTMNDETLNIIGRKHTSSDITEAFKLAREEGFDNINMDIIAGLPGENIDMFINTLEKIKELCPDSLTVHTLSIKRAANLKTDDEKRRLLYPEYVGRMVDIAYEYATCMDMHPYYMYRQKNMLGNHENVGYCKKGCESPYNIHIMEEDQTILATGAGAVSKVIYPDGRIERAFNMKSVEDYLKRSEEMNERKRALLL